MSAVGNIAKNTFKKVFVNLAKELSCKEENIQLGIAYVGGKHQFEAYKDMRKEKNITLDKYVGYAIDFTGGTHVIEATIAQAGTNFAKTLECPVDDIKIVMAYNKDGMPKAVLMRGQEKIRMIDIEKEFISSGL